MESPTPDISIITINFNGYEDTRKLIESIRTNILHVSYEIIVVDNGSSNDEGNRIKRIYPDITVILSPVNKGFSGGNNLGIKIAKGNYILLLNNDTYIENDGFPALIERLEMSPENGAVSPKIKFADGKKNIQFAGYSPLSEITLRNHLIGFGQPDHGQYEKAKQTPYTHGAAMILKKEVIEKVGLMPEIYFLYYEELDWCTKMTNAGYKLWYEPRCTVFHRESSSTGRESSLKVFYLARNRLLYAWRNRKGFKKQEAILYQMVISAPKNCLKYLFGLKFNLAKATLKGNMAFICLKNKML